MKDAIVRNGLNGAAELTKRYGTVKRARGCFLYTAKSVRITDLYQEGGRAILGWGGGSAFTVLKNVLSRGLTGSFDTDFAPRIQKAVSDLLFSPRRVFVFSSKEIALKEALAFSPEDSSVWKPWADADIQWSERAAVIVEPPLPWTGGIYLLAVRGDSAGEWLPSRPELRLPAVLQAAVARSLYNMIAAIQVRAEKDWFIYDTVLRPYWTRRGPYLYPVVPRERYGDFFLHCLENELFISPFYDTPSIVPYGADVGVFRKLSRSPFTFSPS